jgi:DNA replication protein DnaC
MKRAQRVANAEIPKRYADCTLQNFHERQNASLKAARARVAEFIDLWPGADRGLLMQGGCGVGKTHLAVAALHEIIRLGKPGTLHFSNFQDLIQNIQASFSSDQAPSKSEILRPLIDVDLLVLDELGSQKPTVFVQDVLYYVINSRYNDERVTIFTTNYLDDPRQGEESLELRIGERLRSRLHEMTERIVVQSDDYRKNVARRAI